MRVLWHWQGWGELRKRLYHKYSINAVGDSAGFIMHAGGELNAARGHMGITGLGTGDGHARARHAATA
jgi:hypothetical protein